VPERTFWQAAASVLARRDALSELTSHEAFAQWASGEGLAALLLEALPESAGSAPLRTSLRTAVHRQVALAAIQEEELRRVLCELARSNISPVLLKGAALAYSTYPDAALRPRTDTDFLIHPGDASRVRLALERSGYHPEPETSGRLVTAQFHYIRPDSHGIRHACDVHLKIANPQAYANRLSYDELRSEAISLPRLHHDARGPSPVHSLLIACLHRVAHHAHQRADDDLLWLYDIHLLARSLSEGDVVRLLALAAAKELSAVVRDGLGRARDALGGSVSEPVLGQLEDAAKREPPPPLLTATRTIDVALADFAALSGWRARLSLLREHLVPPRSYMRRIYPGCPRWLLPAAYAHRIVRGAPKWLRRQR
jgi:hypothetical protein